MSTVALTFSDIWQEAILGHMMHDYAFFLKCKTHLSPSWFRNPNIGTLVKYTFELHDRVEPSRRVLPEEVMGYIVQMYPDVNSQRTYKTLLVQCATLSCTNVGIDLLQRDMTTWIRLLKFREAMMSAESLFNKGDHDKSRQWLQTTLQDIEQTTFEGDKSVDFSDFDKYSDEMNEQFSNCLSTGSPGLDTLLMRSATTFPHGHDKDPNRLETLTKGDLAPGDTTVIMGASNSGKTSMVISIIAANIRMGKSVLYITHEQKHTDIRWRLLECMVGMTSEELLFAKKNPDRTNYIKIMTASALLTKQLTYFSHTRPDEMWVESVLALIRAQQEEKIAQTGKGYDLLVDDYPGKLRSQKYTSKKSAVWEEQLFVYDQFVNLGRYYNIHVIVPCQTNREGFKITKGDDSYVDQDSVGGSYGVMQLADNVLTLNRSNEDIAQSFIAFYVAKCRSAGMRHGVFGSRTALEYCRTHGFDLTYGIYPPESPVSRSCMRQSILHQSMADKAVAATAKSLEDMEQVAKAEIVPTETFGDFLSKSDISEKE